VSNYTEQEQLKFGRNYRWQMPGYVPEIFLDKSAVPIVRIGRRVPSKTKTTKSNNTTSQCPVNSTDKKSP
jgi:hypothetical protein